jgi:hypothetical protein
MTLPDTEVDETSEPVLSDGLTRCPILLLSCVEDGDEVVCVVRTRDGEEVVCVVLVCEVTLFVSLSRFIFAFSSPKDGVSILLAERAATSEVRTAASVWPLGWAVITVELKVESLFVLGAMRWASPWPLI